MRVNQTKLRLLQGGTVIGVGAGLGSILAAEALSLAGFDFVLVDNQHGAWDDESNTQVFRAICTGSASPFVRVQKNDFYTIGRVLDRGALGVIVPMVNSVEEAKEAARAVRYPPRGGRSIGPFGVSFLGEDYRPEANDQVYLAVQIESKDAVDRAEEILAVDGVDGCWVGPDDLAASMGVQPGDPEHERAIMRVLQVCRKLGKVPGYAAWPHNAQHWIDAGFRFVTIGPELGLMIAQGKQMLASLSRS